MCCKSKEKKTEKGKQGKSVIEIMRKWTIKDWQGIALVSLMGSMIILVLYIVFNTICNRCANHNYRESFNNKVCKIVNQVEANSYNLYRTDKPSLANDSIKQREQYAKEHNATTISEVKECVLIEKEDLEYILQQHITDHSSIMDANNYLAIILTLITLCVTLAAVIPYIMGKSILEKDIKETLEKMEHKESVKYRNLVNQLERAEAHLSRMTAYTLMVEYKLNKCKINDSYKALDLSVHPCWVIGWASKAIIRYQKCTSKGFATDQFMDNCANYIKEASKEIINSNMPYDKNGIVLRAFVDLYDALQLNNIYKPREFQKNVSDLENILCQLWVKLKKCYEKKGTNVDDTLFGLIKQKTKYDEYLDSEATDDDIRKRLNEWKSSCKLQ